MRDDESELLEYIEDNFNNLNVKILSTWWIVGFLILALFILLGALFCNSLLHVILLIIGAGIIGGIWYITALKNTWKLQSEFNTVRIINEFGPFKAVMKDIILVEIFKVRAARSEFRDKMRELEIIFKHIETPECKILLSEIMKEMGISFNDGSREERSFWDEFFRLGKQNQDTEDRSSTDIERGLQ